MSVSYLMLCVLATAVFMVAGMGMYTLLAAGHKVSAELELPRNTDKNKKTPGKLYVINDSWLPVFVLYCWMEWENRLTGESGKERFRFAVLGKKKSCSSFQIETKYSGECLFRIRQAQIRDPFFLFRRMILLQEEKELLILPDIQKVKTDTLKEEAYDCESFRYSDEKKGEDTSEVFQLREYRAGDSMKQVHWKLSAKLDELIVKEASYPIYDSIMVFLETGFAGQRPQPEQLDAQASQAVSVIKSLTDSNVPVEFGYYDFKTGKPNTLRIENEEGFWQAARAVVCAGRSMEGVSGLKRFLESNRSQRFAHYIYVTATEEAPEVEWLSREAKITVLDWKTKISDGMRRNEK